MSIKYIHNILLLFIYFLLFIYIYKYFYYDNLSYLIVSANLLIVFALLYSLKNIKYHIVSFIFYITIFIFLLSMPTIDYIKTGGFIWYTKNIYEFSIKIIMLSVVSILFGTFIAECYYKRKIIKIVDYSINYIKSIRFVTITLFIISYPFYLVINIEKVIYKIQVGDYYAYFATFQSQLPRIVDYVSIFTVYSMIIYLATKPPKIYANMVLFLYVFSNFIMLLTGTRNPFILSILFSFIYYFIRNQDEKGKWIGKKEKLIMVLLCLPIILLMGAINYVRDGESVENMNILDLLLDFLYKQGTSFNVLSWGYTYITDLPQREFKTYSFGHIVDYIYHSKLGNFLFDSINVSEVDRLDMALKSNSLAHNLSYIVFPEHYIKGHGVGDSYIIDNYIDFGFLGVFVLGTVLGFSFITIVRKIYEGNILKSTISFVVLTTIYFMPRGGFSESFTFLFTIPFWFIYFIVIFSAKIILKNNDYILRR